MKYAAECFVAGLIAAGSYGVAIEHSTTDPKFWFLFLGTFLLGFICLKVVAGKL